SGKEPSLDHYWVVWWQLHLPFHPIAAFGCPSAVRRLVLIHIPEHLERRSHLTYLVLLGLTALSAAACGDDAPNDDAPSKPYDPGDSDPNTDFEFDASLADAAVENDAGDDTDEVPSDASGNLSSEVYS